MPVAVPSPRTHTPRTPDSAAPRFEVIGAPSAPLVVALGGISATKHVCANSLDNAPGWWDGVVGPGKPIDTNRFRVLSIDYVDKGTDARGRPLREVTTHDQADALAAALDHIGAARVHAVVGASYGGMVALAFAERYARRLERLVVIGAAHTAHPMTTARRAVQRRIVEMGLDTGRATEALALARALAMTTYRSATEFAERFTGGPDAASRAFPVEGYLDHHGAKFAAAWEPARFLALSLSSDLHSVDPASISVPTTLLAIEDDGIVPPEQMKQLAARLGGSVGLHLLPSRNGHDAFLTQPDTIGPALAAALESGARQ